MPRAQEDGFVEVHDAASHDAILAFVSTSIEEARAAPCGALGGAMPKLWMVKHWEHVLDGADDEHKVVLGSPVGKVTVELRATADLSKMTIDGFHASEEAKGKIVPECFLHFHKVRHGQTTAVDASCDTHERHARIMRHA